MLASIGVDPDLLVLFAVACHVWMPVFVSPESLFCCSKKNTSLRIKSASLSYFEGVALLFSVAVI